mmetsp:Transcript_10862/g.9776  ORF Transcript_10862/g.9776 Transcript_10862/m.9776 type:complete len:276 (+) Transcript_10862:164-991(+)
MLSKIGITDDGIDYMVDSSDLNESLVFKNEDNMLRFQSSMHESSHYSKKRYFDGKVLVAQDSCTTIFLETDLTRVFGEQYRQVEGDTSPICQSSILSALSPTSFVTTLDKMEKLKMIEDDKLDCFISQKTQKCHLISKTTRRFQSNPDNIIFMSREMHENFDGIDKRNEIRKLPAFAIKPVEVCGPIEFEGGFKRVKIIVHIIFKDESELHLSKRLKTGTRRIDLLTFESELYFNDGTAGNTFLQYKYLGTLEDWQQKSQIDDLLVGPEDFENDE